MGVILSSLTGFVDWNNFTTEHDLGSIVIPAGTVVDPSGGLLRAEHFFRLFNNTGASKNGTLRVYTALTPITARTKIYDSGLIGVASDNEKQPHILRTLLTMGDGGKNADFKAFNTMFELVRNHNASLPTLGVGKPDAALAGVMTQGSDGATDWANDDLALIYTWQWSAASLNLTLYGAGGYWEVVN